MFRYIFHLIRFWFGGYRNREWKTLWLSCEYLYIWFWNCLCHYNSYQLKVCRIENESVPRISLYLCISPVLILTAICICGCRAIQISISQHYKEKETPSEFADAYYMLIFGIVQIALSQIPNLHDMHWLSVVAAITSFGYCFIGMGLSIMQIIGMHHNLNNLIFEVFPYAPHDWLCAWTLAVCVCVCIAIYILHRLLVLTSIPAYNYRIIIFSENGYAKGSIEGISTSSGTEKLWLVSQALGDVSFSYPFSTIMMEIQVSIP